ncbi:hypothetical protein NVP1081O_313 [Vibrio phage 1.081.O._10N.286.52.C2]|nr:hypothetical protein NVP1081O_313 [Vibrio phage 1.081.O._10N.286.52.C2]
MNLYDNSKKYVKPDKWWQFFNVLTLYNCDNRHAPTYEVKMIRVFWIYPIFYSKRIVL